MDTHGKQGEVYLQHQKHGKKWKRYWLALHPASQQGVGRLELLEAVNERSTVVVRRHPERKVVRLADCVSVVKLPPHAAACPEENMAAFCVEMEDKRLVFAAEKERCGEWVDIICNNAFEKHTKSVSKPIRLMEDNQICMSREQLCNFKVVVLQNEVSVRCGLRGQYWLQVGEDRLVLQDLETRRTVMEWPHKLLRRYGRDKMLFSIEAGRRCESGPGTFNFETRQSDEIFRLTQSAIHLQMSLAATGDRHSPHYPRFRSPHSPLPRRPDSFTLLDTKGSNSPQPSDTKLPLNLNPAHALDPNRFSVHTKPASPIGLTEHAYANPTDSFCSLKSTQSDPGGRISSIEPVYSNPDVYSDPADAIHLKPNSCVHANATDMIYCRPVKTTPDNDQQQDSVYEYSEVYDHVKPNTSKSLDQTEGPIYGIPEVVQSAQNNNSQSKMSDENQPIYSKVNKPPKTPQSLQEKKLSLTPEVVSEDHGMI
ncbi:docking protein 2-like [Carassius carassius]|uniref:docking protein 2-like n=1 Tax=Carassius carassius TaxID=217509 RepID=UPI002868AEF2|nr:docking protein 2-like [Carassius carassius]